MAHSMTVPMRWRTVRAMACLRVQMGSRTVITSAVVTWSTLLPPRFGSAWFAQARAPPLRGLAGPPRLAVDGDHLLDRLLERRDSLGASPVRERVAAFACGLAVGERLLAGFGQRHQRIAAETERPGPAADDQPLHPASRLGRVDVQVQAISSA